ncbi:MAG TPA: hypothetical protein VFR67_06170 [Pilimelia sp.]|nr:hypothetical protein [Pilimelia sp.]
MHRHGAIAWAEQTAVPGEPLPPIPAECYPAGADDLEVAVDKPDEPEAAHRWWHRIPWRTR